MLLTANISESVHLNALRAAREIGKEKPLPAGVLNAPLSNESTTWINQIWDSVDMALKRAWREGMATARPLIDKVGTLMQQAAEAVGSTISDIRAVLMERLNAYLKEAVDGALQQVRPFVSVGGAMLKLTKVTLEQKVTLSGSLKASLEEICEFVAEGEISLGTEYGA